MIKVGKDRLELLRRQAENAVWLLVEQAADRVWTTGDRAHRASDATFRRLCEIEASITEEMRAQRARARAAVAEAQIDAVASAYGYW